ncbi:hypothetical protein [Streptomyces cucumeris]|uniref:hypothetical protein n=1 Tax=Streptomyces cucumeris TaxID=2962890 RepID=UPI0020C90927|nr:hypothetical protein [Streptomyces sp. NEAU-Y11]MCP9209604.1 hypothetical protein [Streptomyces sp. NEAU-Y11]
MNPDLNAMSLYLCSWLHDPVNPMPYLETVQECLTSARQTFAKRDMSDEESLRWSYLDRVAKDGPDEELLTWAVRVADALNHGMLQHDPWHPSNQSAYSYRGFPLTFGDLEELFWADIPDGG